jgi:putative redox protein
MKVTLKRVDNDFHMEASVSSDTKVHIDASEKTGGHNLGARPMELVLTALASCSSIDLLSILKKQRMNPEELTVDIEGKRAESVYTSPFTDIHMEFNFRGNLDEIKVKRAIELSVEKYCSVYEMLKHTVNITYSYSIVQ